MSLDKSIASGKDRRKQYKGTKRIDCTCRNHGSCTYCRSNRTYKNQKKLEKAIDKMKEWAYNNNSDND